MLCRKHCYCKSKWVVTERTKSFVFKETRFYCCQCLRMKPGRKPQKR